MSYAGLGQLGGVQCGDMPDIGQAMGIDPRARAASTGARIVPTVWAQRAANAAGVRTTVDGIAGSGTLRSLTTAWTNMGRSGAQPVLVDRDHVAISPGFEGGLSLLRRVADPSGSTCGVCQWSACAGGTTTPHAPPPTPGPTTPTTPGPTTPAPDGSSAPPLVAMPSDQSADDQGGVPLWVWGAAAGTVALLGIWFVTSGRPVSANRRQTRRNPRRRVRRVRRNAEHEDLRYHQCPRSESWWEYDAQGIPLTRVCDKCRTVKLSRYRPEILTGYSQEDVDEPIEPEEW